LGFWRDQLELPEITLGALQAAIRETGAIVRPGGDFDAWDLEVQGGLLGASRLRLAVEEHAPKKQLLRFRISPRYSRLSGLLGIVLGALSAGAFFSGAWLQSVVAAAGLALVLRRAIADTGFSGGILREALKRFEPGTASEGPAARSVSADGHHPRPQGETIVN
jgi:hypothetical protein